MKTCKVGSRDLLEKNQYYTSTSTSFPIGFVHSHIIMLALQYIYVYELHHEKDDYKQKWNHLHE